MKLSIDCWTKPQKWYLGRTKCYCKNILNVTCVIFCSPVCNIFVLFFFMVQFFTMHETLHTYRFWVWRKNTFPSFHASWRRITIYHNNIRSILKKCWSFVETFFKAILQKSILFLLVTWHDLPLFQSVFPKIDIISLSYATCSMMYDAYVMQRWCDDVMLCKVIFRRYTHVCAIKHIIFLWISVDFSL